MSISKFGSAGKHILVAEDNVINQEITVHLLKKAGFQVSAVFNGREAVDALEKSHFDLILMDCQMPEMDGYEATRAIRAKGSQIPIVALTANAYKEDRERCMAAGMTDYVTKPVNDRVLFQAIDNALSAGADSVLDREVFARLEALDEDGSQRLIARLIELFLQTTPEGLAELHRLAAAGDVRLKKQAHFLKSSHANLGANRVVDVLQTIEDGNYDASGLVGLLGKLHEESDLVQAELRAILKTK